MNTKVANVIAVELGILIVILAWLAFSNFSRVKQPTLAEEQAPADSSFATVTSLPRPANLRYSAADYFTVGGAATGADAPVRNDAIRSAARPGAWHQRRCWR